MSDRVTPHDLQAERAILAALLVDGDRYFEAAEQISGADFFRVAHRTIYEAVAGLVERRQPIDLVTLKNGLTPEALEEVGGLAYVAGIMCDGVPSAHIAAHCQIVKDLAIRRRVQAAADQAIREASDPEFGARDVLERAEEAIYAIASREQAGEVRSAESVLTETTPILTQIMDHGSPVTGVPTGFFDLDEMTRGLQPGNLVLLAARPAMGKTALALNVAYHVGVRVHTPVMVFSLEMTRTELMIRMLTAAGRVDAHRVMQGRCHAGELQRLGGAEAEIATAPIWIDDTSSLTVTGIRGKARRHKQRRGLGLLVIDYLQLLSSERRYDSRVVEVGAMSRALKQLAKELSVPVLCLAQLNRQAEARSDGRPKLSDLRESGSLEQDADLVLLMHRASEYSAEADPTDAEIIVAKHRNGPTGNVRLRWNRESTRFDNLSHAA